MTENPYAPRPAGPVAALTPDQERSWAIGVHAVTGAATVLSAGTLGFVAALAVYLVYKDRGPFVRHASANAANIQLNGLLWYVLLGIGGFLTLGVGWLLLFAVPVVVVVLHVLAALANSRGEFYDPPMTIRFLR